MADQSFPIKQCVITIVQGATTITAAVGQGGDLTVEFDVEELFGQESIERQDEWVNAYHPRIRIAHAKFDGQVLGLLLGTTTADEDVDGNTLSGYTRAEITAASYARVLFNVKGVFTHRGDNKEFAFLVENIVWENLGFPIPREGWIVRNLRGTGRTVKFHYPTPA